VNLSPSQHAHIRLHLALIPAWLMLVEGWRGLLSRLPIGAHATEQFSRDFAGVAYVPGLIANRGDASALYDIGRLTATLGQIVPAMHERRYPPFYGPQISVFFSPLARLPYGSALIVWMAVSLLTYLACAFAVLKACPRLRDRRAAVALLLLADPALYYTLSFGHISAIALACVTLAFLALRAGRGFLAGVAIGSLIYKPSFGVAPAIVFVAAAEWRIVLGAVTGAALQFAAAGLFWGPSILLDYGRAVVRLGPDMRDELTLYHLHSWRGFFEILGWPDTVAFVAYVIAAAVVLALAVRCWRSTAPLAVRFAVVVIATVLVNPHMYVYDFVIMMPAFLVLWDWIETERPQRTPSTQTTMLLWLLYVCYWSPNFAIVAVKWHVQLSVPLLTLLAAVAATTAWRTRPTDWSSSTPETSRSLHPSSTA
jgi:glycosyl transferase family 87